MLCCFPVVLQRFDARGLFRGAHHGQISNFEQLGRREKHHVYRVVIDGIAEATLVDHQRPHPGAFGFNRRRQAGRACANANQVVLFHGDLSLPGVPADCKLKGFYCFAGRSRIAHSSRRNASSSPIFSGVASTWSFFQTKSSPEPPISFTLRLPSSR